MLILGLSNFNSAILGTWLALNFDAWPEIYKNVRNAIDMALSTNREWIMEGLERISKRSIIPLPPSCLGKRARSDDGQDEDEGECGGHGKGYVMLV